MVRSGVKFGMNRQEIKAKAKEFAFKNKWNIWKPYLVIFAISFVFGLILGIFEIDTENGIGSLLAYAFEIALIPASIGYIYYIMELINGKVLDVKEALLSKYKLFGLILVTSIMVSLFTTLWTLLLIIPGIIYAFKVAMVNYILADSADENTKWKDVINTSKEMMNGYKMDYFVFGLSFIGWELLCIVTLGIAIIWVYPYMQVANVMYYQELKKIKNIK